MSDPRVRRTGEVYDIGDRAVIVGVDHDTVSIQVGGMQACLTSSQAEEFAQLFVAACWEAATQAGELAAGLTAGAT
jgi:hypothetical protein